MGAVLFVLLIVALAMGFLGSLLKFALWLVLSMILGALLLAGLAAFAVRRFVRRVS